MQALKVKEAAPCRCGGQVKLFGPCEFAPRSHWGGYCSRDACQQMVAGESLEGAIERWNQLRAPIHS